MKGRISDEGELLSKLKGRISKGRISASHTPPPAARIECACKPKGRFLAH